VHAPKQDGRGRSDAEAAAERAQLDQIRVVEMVSSGRRSGKTELDVRYFRGRGIE